MTSLQLVNHTRKEFFRYAEDSATILQALKTTGWALADDVRISIAPVSTRIDAGYTNIREHHDIDEARQKLQALYELAVAKAPEITTLRELRGWLIRNDHVSLVGEITDVHLALACLLKDTRLVREGLRDNKVFKCVNGVLRGPFSPQENVNMTEDTFMGVIDFHAERG
jgi:hypothetical protein